MKDAKKESRQEQEDARKEYNPTKEQETGKHWWSFSVSLI